MLAAYAFAFTNLGSTAWADISAHLGKSHTAAAPEIRRGFVLVVGATPEHETDVSLTVSPRGYVPVFMSSGHKALNWMQTTKSSVAIALIERSAPDEDEAVEAVKRVVPDRHLIRIGKQATSSEIAQLLLNVM